MRIAYPYPEHLGHSPTRLLQVAATVKSLVEQGIKVHFLVGSYSGLDRRLAELGLAGLAGLAVERLPMLQPGPGRYWRFSWHWPFNKAAAFRLGELARLDRLGVLVRHLKLAAYLCRKLSPGAAPLIYEAHELFEQSARENGARAGKLARLAALESAVLAGADRVVAISRPLARALEERPEVKHPVAVAPSGVEQSFFRIPSEGRERGLVAYCGGLAQWKGVDLLVEAMTFCRSSRLEILGGAPGSADWQRVEILLKRLGVGQRVVMRPQAGRDEVAALLARAQVAVWPGSAKRRIAAEFTSPLKLFEYLAAGCAVVAPDLPAANSLLTHRKNAWLFKPDQPMDLARALETLLQDGLFASQMAERGRNLAWNYTWEARANILLGVLEEALR